MASLPIFITAVANSADEPSFPLLFTWSTHDAEIKEVLVTPDDDWLHSAAVESNIQNIDENQLYEFGYEAGDILSEWTSEFDTDTVYALQPQNLALLVEAIFDSKGLEPTFEVLDIYDWFLERGLDLRNEWSALGNPTPLELMPLDEQIASLLQIAAENELIEAPEREADYD
ncbi:hypothetical protein [Marinomonas mediterranea]|uniref:hypothetical protein n=1 Tax=Marinomonas mediterranea TaxID=119864 RepID=UPI0023496D33|nr:hypothetical protein [Marinomonas mediterranea]WCN09311.1 hypothetical protein GV055_10400 [Marinomonas mediterranea]